MTLSEKDFIGTRTICAEQGPFYGWNIGQKEAFLGVFKDPPAEGLSLFTKFLKQERLNISRTKVLEIGSSDGRNAAYLNLKGFDNVTGVDNNASYIAQARRRCAVLGCRVNFQEFDLRDKWPYQDGSVGVIADCNTTACMEDIDRKKVAQEAYRVLASGGYYIFCGGYLVAKNGIEQRSAIVYTEEKVRRNYVRFKSRIFIEGRKIDDFPKRLEYKTIVAVFQK